jgi:hypothetical protein
MSAELSSKSKAILALDGGRISTVETMSGENYRFIVEMEDGSRFGFTGSERYTEVWKLVSRSEMEQTGTPLEDWDGN